MSKSLNLLYVFVHIYQAMKLNCKMQCNFNIFVAHVGVALAGKQLVWLLLDIPNMGQEFGDVLNYSFKWPKSIQIRIQNSEVRNV